MDRQIAFIVFGGVATAGIVYLIGLRILRRIDFWLHRQWFAQAIRRRRRPEPISSTPAGDGRVYCGDFGSWYRLPPNPIAPAKPRTIKN